MCDRGDLLALRECGQRPVLDRLAPGRITFVGTGAGDPLHLTLAGVHALWQADDVVVGRRVPEALVDAPELGVPESAEIWRGEDPAADVAALKAMTEAGEQVVWLTRGDPLADGEAYDLAPLLVEAGCEIGIVPGLAMTSLAATTSGIRVVEPVSVRRDDLGDVSSSIVFTNTHDLPDVVATALGNGWAKSTPVFLVFNYATTSQRTVRSTLSKAVKSIGAGEESADLFLIIGAIDRNEALNWYESKPLFGWKVLVPRTKGMPGVLERRIEEHGASSVQVPTLAVEPPRNIAPAMRAIEGLVEGSYQWAIFNSPDAVRVVTERLGELGLDARAFSGLRIAAIGEGTVSALRRWGIQPDFVPVGEQRWESLAAEFPVYDDVLDPIDRILIPRAEIAVEDLADALTELGWTVDDVMVCRTVRAAPPPAHIREGIKSGEFDAVVFTSATAVRNMIGIAGKPHPTTVVAAIGPATVEACEDHGLRVDVVSPTPGLVPLVDALAEFAAESAAEQIAAGKPVKRPSQRRRRRRIS